MAEIGSYDLVVNEDNIDSRATNILDMESKVEEALSTYCDCLKVMIDEGFEEGKVNENLKVFYESAVTLKGELSSLSTTYAKMGWNFEADLDKKDDYLY